MTSWLYQALGYSDDVKDARKVNARTKREPKAADALTREITMEEVRKHKSRESCWMVIQGRVYDVTSFIDEHPGQDIILDGAGRDATDLFRDIGHSNDAEDMLTEMQIGILVKPTKSPTST
jgi:cytochrome b involved in lipid metabolism